MFTAAGAAASTGATRLARAGETERSTVGGGSSPDGLSESSAQVGGAAESAAAGDSFDTFLCRAAMPLIVHIASERYRLVTPTKVVAISVMGRGNVNAFLLLGHKAVLVDTGIPGSGPKIMAALAKQSVGPADVSAIVVTHGHVDHFGAAAHLRRALKVPIIAHGGDAEAYASGQGLAGSLRPTGPFGWVFSKLPPAHARAEPFVADVMVDEPISLRNYGVDARILLTPGHTPGSISVLADSGELIAADLIAGPLLGAIRRRPANPPFHQDRLLNLASLDSVLKLNPSVIHVGHGGPLDPSDVRRWVTREHRKLVRNNAR